MSMFKYNFNGGDGMITDFNVNPDSVLWSLRGLPAYPVNAGEVNNTADAAFIVASGPACLIQEVLLPPPPVFECPVLMYDKLEEARICHNAGQYEGALRRLRDAFAIWRDRGLWRPLNRGLTLDDIYDMRESHAQAKQERRIRREERRLERERRVEEAARAKAQAEADRKARGSDYEEEEEEEEYEVKRRFYSDDEDEGEREGGGDEGDGDDGGGNESEEEEESDEEEEEPEISLEEKMEFDIFISNYIGSVYASQNNDYQALCYFWRAKLYHSEYLVDRHYLLTKPSSSPTPASPTSYKSIGGIGAGAGRDRRAAQEPDHAADARGNDGGGDRSDGDGDGDGDAEIDALYRKAAYASSTSSSLSRPSFLFGSSHAAMQRNAGMGYGGEPGSDLSSEAPVIDIFDGACPATAVTYSNLGAACYHLGKHMMAIKCFFAAQQIRFQCIHEESDEYVDIGSTLNNIGVCLHALKRHQEAYAYFLSAEELLCERLDTIHPRINCIRNNLEKVRPKRKNIRVSDEIMQRVVVEQRPPKVDIRKWNVNISDYEKLLIKFGKPKKKKRKGKGKKKKNKSK